VRVSLRPTTSFALGLAVMCVLLAAVTGAFAPAAAAAPDAAQIDDFLMAHSSPMTGAGATFVAEGRAHGVDPAFLVAITGAETSFGALLYSENGDQCTYNAFNWFYGATWPQSDFGSWDEAIARVAEGLSGSLYYGSGLYSVLAIAPRYCPDGTDNWINNVTSFMTQLGGDPADTRLVATSAIPPDTLPGLVALDGSVRLAGGAREVGRDVSVRFTITNSGGQPIALDGIRLAVRGPNGVSADLVSDQAVTLAPGQPLAVSASWPLDTVGPWHGWIEVTQNGQPSLVGETRAFAFRVSLPRDLVVRRWIRTETSLSSSR
jgi:hypothetical protein